MKIYITTLLLFCMNFSIAQNQTEYKRCHTTEIHEMAYQTDPVYRHNYDIRAAELEEIKNSPKHEGRLNCTAPITIPVAIHYEGITNQSMDCLTSMALSQLDVLNADFSATNSDFANYAMDVANSDLTEAQSAAEGTCVQFCLATSGHPSGFGLNEGDYAITINENYVANNNFPNFTNGTWAGYLNIFVTDDTGDIGLLGYSPLAGLANGDGVVIGGCVFGATNTGCGSGFGSGGACQTGFIQSHSFGRTTTHEVGHYLGLPHPWGSGNSGTESCSDDDGFADTPNSSVVYSGCPTLGASSTTCGSQDMFMNYMDYSDEICAYMFSEDQANMVYTIANSRWNPTSTKCSLVSFQNDASISSIVSPEAMICGNVIDPVVILKNFGVSDLTQVDINYSITGGGSGTFNWTGVLAQYGTETISLPSLNATTSNITLTVSTSNPNGVTDENLNNDTKILIISSLIGANLPFTEDVEDFTTPFPAQGIEIENPDDDNHAWDRRPGASAYGNGIYSIFFNNFDAFNGAGKEDWLILPEMEVAGFNSVNLTYDYAYTYFSDGATTKFDAFKVMYSIGCSEVWEEVYADQGISLATAAPSANFYLPNATSDWVNKTIGINTGGSGFIRIALVNISGNGNNIFIDNINIQGSSAVVSNNEIASLNTFTISPNPSRGNLNLDIQFNEVMDYEIRIHDAVGRNVYSAMEHDLAFQNQINVAHLSNGIYFVSIIAGDKIVTKKVLLAK